MLPTARTAELSHIKVSADSREGYCIKAMRSFLIIAVLQPRMCSMRPDLGWLPSYTYVAALAI